MPDGDPTSRKPPAGWYAEPGNAGRLRWWDGEKWTEHQPLAAEAAPASSPSSASADRLSRLVDSHRKLILATGGGLLALMVIIGIAVNAAGGSPVKVDDVDCTFRFNGSASASVFVHNESDHLASIVLHITAEKDGDTYVDDTSYWDVAPNADTVLETELDAAPVGDGESPECKASISSDS